MHGATIKKWRFSFVHYKQLGWRLLVFTHKTVLNLLKPEKEVKVVSITCYRQCWKSAAFCKVPRHRPWEHREGKSKKHSRNDTDGWKPKYSDKNMCKNHFIHQKFHLADPGCRAVQGMGVRPLASWDCGFESHGRHGCSLANVCCDAEISATSRSLVQRIPTQCVSLSVIRCNSNRLHLTRSKRSQTKKKKKKKKWRRISEGLLVSNPGLQGKRPATNSLSHGTVSKR